MTVGDYQYNYTYLVELKKYYNDTVKIHNYGKLVRICKEIERLNKLLKINEHT